MMTRQTRSQVPAHARRTDASARPRSQSLVRLGLGLTATFVLVSGCSFPEHDFIPDSEFHNNGGAAASGGSGAGGSGAGGSGAGGSGAGGSGATGGVAGNGATGGVAGTGAGGSGGSGETNCHNGLDDDEDGLTDCADPDCQTAGYECVSLPDGWSGPVAAHEGPFGDSPPACGGQYPTVEINAFDAPNQPANCAACTCSTPTGAACGLPVNCEETGSCPGVIPENAGLYRGLSLWTAAGCTGTGAWSFPVSTSCQSFGLTAGDPPEAPLSVEATAPAVTGGSCLPAGGGTLGGDPWSLRVRGCGSASLDGGGCVGTSTCLPPAGSAFDRGVCVYRDGDHACPSPFDAKRTLYRSFVDERVCTACSCGAASGIECAGDKVDVWAAGGCTGSPFVTVTDPGTTCTDANPGLTVSFRYTPGTPTGGSCPPSGGQSTGTATATDPVTFCCKN